MSLESMTPELGLCGWASRAWVSGVCRNLGHLGRTVQEDYDTGFAVRLSWTQVPCQSLPAVWSWANNSASLGLSLSPLK